MKVTINYVTGRTRTIIGISGVTIKPNKNGILVLELTKSSGTNQEILISTISHVVYEYTTPVQRIQAVFIQ